MPRVVSINISEKKGTSKKPVSSGVFGINEGLVGDAHSGPGERQVSLIAKESIDRFNKNVKLKRLCAKKGMFGENLTTEGIQLHKLKVGTKLKINALLLEITQIGKECDAVCAIGRRLGTCIMPKEGVFARVIHGGSVRPEDTISICSYSGIATKTPRHKEYRKV